MAYKYIGDATLGVGLTVTAPKPLDSRSVVSTLLDLYSLPKDNAYQGMTVANIQDGNMYMLIDKSKMNEKAGWKASYESLQIIACSLEEYEARVKNTSKDFTPLDPDLPYIYSNTYYYTYDLKPKDGTSDESTLTLEDFYLSSKWGKQIEASLVSKASADIVNNISNSLDELKKSLPITYLSIEDAELKYALLADFDLEDPESFISTNFYTKLKLDADFVTKESLRGTADEGQDDFIFVTQTQYNKDLELILTELDKTLKTDSDGSLQSITVSLIKAKPQEGEEQLIINLDKNGLSIKNDPLAKISEVPKIITITSTEYKALEKEGKINPDVYYYVYDTAVEDVYVTKKYLQDHYETSEKNHTWANSQFYTQTQIQEKYLTIEASKVFALSTDISDTYATLVELNLVKDDLKNNYLTKKDVSGEGDLSGDFLFVTKTEYDEHVKNAEAILAKNVKVNDLGFVETLPVAKLTNGLTNVTLTGEGVFINDESIAKLSELPKLTTLTLEEYDSLTQVDPDTYYYIYDVKNENLIYVTKEYLTLHYKSFSDILNWCSNEFYAKTDKTLALKLDLDKYVLSSTLLDNYLQASEIASTYALASSLNQLSKTLTNDYVTKESLRGTNTSESDDFIFVTLTAYKLDQQNQAKSFTSEQITSNSLNINNSILDVDSNKLRIDTKPVALLEDVPLIVCLSESDYDKIPVKDTNTYYYTYNLKEDDGYVTVRFLEGTFYKKSDIDTKISDLENKIKALNIQMQEIWNFFADSATSLIDKNTLISNITIISKNEHN